MSSLSQGQPADILSDFETRFHNNSTFSSLLVLLCYQGEKLGGRGFVLVLPGKGMNESSRIVITL